MKNSQFIHSDARPAIHDRNTATVTVWIVFLGSKAQPQWRRLDSCADGKRSSSFSIRLLCAETDQSYFLFLEEVDPVLERQTRTVRSSTIRFFSTETDNHTAEEATSSFIAVDAPSDPVRSVYYPLKPTNHTAEEATYSFRLVESIQHDPFIIHWTNQKSGRARRDSMRS